MEHKSSNDFVELGAQFEAQLVVLRQKVGELEAEKKELEAFNYTVAHDLYAPLLIIEGYTESLLETGANKFDAQEDVYLQRISQASREAKHLLSKLLSLSKATHLPLSLQRIDLTAMAGGILAEISQREPGRNTIIDVQPALFVYGDAALVHLMMANLLANAWKFTAKSKQPRIEVGCNKSDAGHVLYVRDNGVGFDQAMSEKLFNVFQRCCNSDEFKGSGVGLAIVERIVTRHGGKIWAQGAISKGASFYFELPSPRLNEAFSRPIDSA